jgi:hypothetical protein
MLSQLIPNVSQGDENFATTLEEFKKEYEKTLQAKLNMYGFDSIDDLTSTVR